MKIIGIIAGLTLALGTGAIAQTLPTSLPTDVNSVATAAAGSAASDALTVENFDPEVVNQLIDQAPVGDETKTTLKQGVQAAADNPEMLQSALDQVKAAIGM